MKKTVLAILLLMGPVLSAGAQEVPDETKDEKAPAGKEVSFKPELDIMIHFSETGFSNWASGGENSTSWQAAVDAGLIYETPRFIWVNEFVLKYGKSEIEGIGGRKQEDKLKFKTRYNRKIWENINPYAEFMFETQLAPGFDYDREPAEEISRILDPAYIRQTVGMSLKPADVFTIRTGFGMKQTLAEDFAERYIGPGGETVINTAGASLSFHLDAPVMENVRLRSDMSFFGGFYALDRVDVEWENVISAAVNDFIKVRYDFVVLYNKNTVHAAQIKNVLSVGIAYSFFKQQK
ncbi:MAG: DUF3078 domain-containing protein [Candidatus Goldiibacteriota bacterium]